MLHIYCSQVLALHCVLTSNITSGSGVKYYRMQCHQIFRAWRLKTFQETVSYITLYYTKYNILRSILSPDITLFFVLKYYILSAQLIAISTFAFNSKTKSYSSSGVFNTVIDILIVWWAFIIPSINRGIYIMIIVCMMK